MYIYFGVRELITFDLKYKSTLGDANGDICSLYILMLRPQQGGYVSTERNNTLTSTVNNKCYSFCCYLSVLHQIV